MGTQFWHILEIAIISGVIIYQIIHSKKVYSNTNHLKTVFKSKLFLRNGYIKKDDIGNVDFNSSNIIYDDNIDITNECGNEIADKDFVKIPLVDSSGKHPIINKIKGAINTYLINNHGASVNFSIIKDIIDREIEVKDDEISQSIPLPLYLGLAATMIGIIFGLFSMPEIDNDGFTLGINTLINGVKIAMIGSLSGLLCTTFLSSFSYKNAKQVIQKEKNEQISYLQAKLLPELLKAEDTGISGLKASLDRFARVAINISDNVLIAANQTGENLKLQNKVIEKVDNMQVLKVSKWNLDLFEKMDKNMESFKQFSSYISKMERITSQLQEFGNRTSDITRIINGIDHTLEESRNLTRFLSSHFEKIENSGNAALKSVGIAEMHFENAIELLKERTEGMVTQLYKSAGNHEDRIESIYKQIEESLNSITSQYVNAFREAYSNSIPNFEQLDNLDLMKEINISLNGLKDKQILMNKLNSIEESLKKRISYPTNGAKTERISPIKEIEVNTLQKSELTTIDKVTPITEVFEKLFKNKQK